MARLIIMLNLLFVVYSSSGQNRTPDSKPSNCCISKYGHEQWETLGIDKLGAEYRRLKAAKCERCESSGGDFVAILNVLGDRLNGRTKKEVIKVMGKPDEKWSDTCVYFWRGQRDYLYFNFPNGKGVSQWYYALE